MKRFLQKFYLYLPILVRILALLLSAGYYYEIIKTSKMSFDYGPGVLVFGAIVSLLANIGIWLITFPLKSWVNILSFLLFIPAYIVGSFVAFHYHTIFGFSTVILLGRALIDFLQEKENGLEIS